MRLLLFVLPLTLSTVAAQASGYTKTDFIDLKCPMSTPNSNTDDKLVMMMEIDGYVHSIDSSTTEWCSLWTGFDTLGGKSLRVSDASVVATGDDAFMVGKIDVADEKSDPSHHCVSTDPTDKLDYSTCHANVNYHFEDDGEAVYAGTVARREMYTVRINVWHNKISGETSNNDFRISFYSNGAMFGAADVVYAGNGEYGATWVPTVPPSSIDEIVIMTKGNDAMYLDFVELKHYEPGDTKYTELHQWGGNNGKGWCSSEDASDGTGSWSNYLYASDGVKCSDRLSMSVDGTVSH